MCVRKVTATSVSTHGGGIRLLFKCVHMNELCSQSVLSVLAMCERAARVRTANACVRMGAQIWSMLGLKSIVQLWPYERPAKHTHWNWIIAAAGAVSSSRVSLNVCVCCVLIALSQYALTSFTLKRTHTVHSASCLLM